LDSATKNDEDIFSQIDIQKEYGKSVIRLWTSINCSEEFLYKFIYEIPQDIYANDYSLSVQKQPGAVNQNIKIIVEDKIIFEGTFNKDFIIDLP